ncbi:MAG: hypothetical protein HFH88_14910 [Lachnospiraceae bacterium]|nr:hypothetical protein [Lachnospiraceae bacterium]
MKFIENRHGIIADLREVGIIGKGDIIIKLNRCYSDEIIEEMEMNLSAKFGRKVILLDARYGEILTLPPEKNGGGDTGRP